MVRPAQNIFPNQPGDFLEPQPGQSSQGDDRQQVSVIRRRLFAGLHWSRRWLARSSKVRSSLAV